MTSPAGGNNIAAAGDREYNVLTNTSCPEEACWNPDGQEKHLEHSKQNELVCLRPGVDEIRNNSTIRLMK